MKFNFDKLKGKIKEVCKTQEQFAFALNIGTNTLSSKLNNISDFTSEEIVKSVEILHVENPEEAWNLFFTKEVENNSTNSFQP